MTEKIEVEKFKNLFMDMYRGFPNWRYREMLEKVVVTENDRKQLVKHGFLLEEKTQTKQYSLGPNGLLLVNSWKVEEMTNKMLGLTFVVALIALTQAGVSILSPLIYSGILAIAGILALGLIFFKIDLPMKLF